MRGTQVGPPSATTLEGSSLLMPPPPSHEYVGGLAAVGTPNSVLRY